MGHRQQQHRPIARGTSYQDDASTYLDYSGYQGTASNLGSYQFRSLPHPLAAAIKALGVTRGPDSYPPSPFPVYDVPGGGAFYTVWETVSGPAGPLGEPADSWYSINGGQEQDFQGGGIYWSAATNTYEVQGDIHSEYVNTWGGPTGALNFPTSNEQNAYNSSGAVIGRENTFRGTGCTANNQGSAIIWSSGTGAYAVIGCIYQKYLALGGTTSFLGLPTSEEVAINNGHVSYFQGTSCGSGGGGGGIFDGPASGVYEVHGCIFQEYMAVKGGPNGVLSFPTSDEQGIAGGRVSYFYGVRCGGVATGPDNSGSAIYHLGANTQAVQGCVYATYQRLNGPAGPLGFPVSDENGVYNSSGTLIGWTSYFAGVRCGTTNPYGSGSAIYVPASNNSASGGHEVQGCVFTTYQRLGGPAGLLGFPVSDENTFHDSSGNTIGWASYFAGTSCGTSGTSGSGIFVPASNNNASGGHEVHGCIYYEYVTVMGGPAGMGFPTSDEQPITNSAGTVIGSVSYFSAHLCNGAGPYGSGSAIYHLGPNTHEVQGCIYYKYWHDLGGPTGCLGFPTSDEYTADGAGDRESDFQNGFIFWVKSTGAIVWSCG